MGLIRGQKCSRLCMSGCLWGGYWTNESQREHTSFRGTDDMVWTHAGRDGEQRTGKSQ